ncbi:ANTAR domain-containing protein [Actinocatenispora sera]|uniref:ANTAR domain-containing protein n=1 Tax=Actinocatenispora sera TaxID=390989 RepID=UPI0033DD10EA
MDARLRLGRDQPADRFGDRHPDVGVHDHNEQAFQLLRATSQNLNRKLRDVARDVTDPGELPAQG